MDSNRLRLTGAIRSIDCVCAHAFSFGAFAVATLIALLGGNSKQNVFQRLDRSANAGWA
jgi:hypothetical protein